MKTKAIMKKYLLSKQINQLALIGIFIQWGGGVFSNQWIAVIGIGVFVMGIMTSVTNRTSE